MEWREGSGLYAIGVEWTENAAAMIAAGEYKFISPVFGYNRRGEVIELLHAALTNTPALDGMDAVMLAAASRLASLSTETETTTVDEELLQGYNHGRFVGRECQCPECVVPYSA